MREPVTWVLGTEGRKKRQEPLGGRDGTSMPVRKRIICNICGLSDSDGAAERTKHGGDGKHLRGGAHLSP